jgi:DNA-directed RNA polymerase specialized sigma24 family protein
LAALDDPYRTALTLRFIDGLAFAEIATQMETLPRTARTWVGRGLSTLRLRLGGRQ